MIIVINVVAFTFTIIYSPAWEERTVALIRINAQTVLNTDAVAWIEFKSDEDRAPEAVVHFLHADRTGDLVRQVFAGVDASIFQDLVPIREFMEEGRERTVATVAFQPMRKKKAWFFSQSGDRPVFLAFINAKGSCSLRSYDYETGIFVGKQYHAGDYQEGFPELLEKSRELAVEAQPNLERDCKVRLPDRVLSYLKKQVVEEGHHV
jgi:hypothetical protein